MPYVNFDQMDSEEQMSLLHKAVQELQERFQAHRHMDNGRVTVGVRDMPTTDLGGKFVDEDC